MRELKALRNLRDKVRRLRMTPPVDDDFPEVLDDMYRAYDEADRLNGNSFDLIEHLDKQIKFSINTFGPGQRTKGIIDHVKKELIEIKSKPDDLEEWIDLAMLALDGAWRCGMNAPEQIVTKLEYKQNKNEGRQWPDWRTAEPGKAIEHVRSDNENNLPEM